MLTTIINDIRGLIGRDVTFYIVASSYPCTEPGCDLNPVTGDSTNPYCTVCSGYYYIPVMSGVTMSGHITWGGADQMNWVTGGQFFEGDCRLQVEYSPANKSTVRNCKYVIVDDKRMTVRHISYRGVPELNRMVITLDEEE